MIVKELIDQLRTYEPNLVMYMLDSEGYEIEINGAYYNADDGYPERVVID